MANPTRTKLTVVASKLIRKFIKYTKTLKSYYYNNYNLYYYNYYNNGGIGTGNLLPRYENIIPQDYFSDDFYIYFKIKRNIPSIPPFSYNNVLSSYQIVFNSLNGSNILTATTLLFSDIQTIGNVNFDENATWVNPINQEELKEGYFRVLKTTLENYNTGLGGNGNYQVPFLQYEEIWGSGNYPTGVRYTNNSILSVDSSWKISTLAKAPLFITQESLNNGSLYLQVGVVDTGTGAILEYFVKVFDSVNNNQLVGFSQMGYFNHTSNTITTLKIPISSGSNVYCEVTSRNLLGWSSDKLITPSIIIM